MSLKQRIKFKKDVFIWSKFNGHILYLNHLHGIKRRLIVRKVTEFESVKLRKFVTVL